MARSISLTTRNFPVSDHAASSTALEKVPCNIPYSYAERGWGKVFVFPHLRHIVRRALHIDQWQVIVIVVCLLIGGQWAWTQRRSLPTTPGISMRIATPAHSATPILHHTTKTLRRAPGVAPLPPPTWVIVARTGGKGLFVRVQPRQSRVLAAWPDGTRLHVIGPRRSGAGHSWLHVHDPAGHIGWVAAEFVMRASPSKTG